MSTTKINPAALRWARENAGLSLEEISKLLRFSPGSIDSFEQGRTGIYTLFNQVESDESLLYSFAAIYHVPLSLFSREVLPKDGEVLCERAKCRDVFKWDSRQNHWRLGCRVCSSTLFEPNYCLCGFRLPGGGK